MITVRRGSRGNEVKTLQSNLNIAGNYKLDVDGIFGLKTENAVKDFQKLNNLGVDGICGPKTWKALTESINNLNSKIAILIDNGHGVDTAGKQSPDGQYKEWEYTREIANRVVETLRSQGYNAILVTPEDKDIALSTRVKRINEYCDKLGTKNVCLVSIHSNAAGNGNWLPARGWSSWTSKGQTAGDKLADCLYDAAEAILPPELPDLSIKKLIRTDLSDGDRDYESNFYILIKSKCAATLTENMFHDNKEDVKFLLSEKGKQAITDVHVEGIKKYVKTYMLQVK